MKILQRTRSESLLAWLQVAFASYESCQGVLLSPEIYLSMKINEDKTGFLKYFAILYLHLLAEVVFMSFRCKRPDQGGPDFQCNCRYYSSLDKWRNLCVTFKREGASSPKAGAC